MITAGMVFVIIGATIVLGGGRLSDQRWYDVDCHTGVR
jgi:hypothetical protein